MHCRDITTREFETLAAELTGVSCQADGVETVSGQHGEYGFALLVRDASRCIALLEDPGLSDTLRAGRLSAADRAAQAHL